MSSQKKPTNLKIHDFPIESFIGGCYIPDKVCDDLIDFFDSSEYKSKIANFNFLEPTDYDEQDDF